MIINIDDSSEVPKYAEPWFLLFNAEWWFSKNFLVFDGLAFLEDFQRKSIDA
jgi:hypothetical protein